MIATFRGGGRSSSSGPARIPATWGTVFAVGLLIGLYPSPCAAQPPTSGFPSVSGNPTGTGAQIPPGSTLPGGSPSAGLGQPATGGPAGSAAGAQPSLGGLPAIPGAGGVGIGGAGPMSWNATGAMQPPPSPMPARAEVQQPVGPLPLPALVRFPSITLDHYGDGSGTVGSYLVWDGQLPHQYRITRYHDGDGKVGGPIPWLAWITPHPGTVNTKGTLGYGPPGLHPGFFGFGLSFHPGYGYGGNALGVGALGGYPCYGGPGYALQYGYPKFAYPYYQGIGQLYYDQPVVISDLMDAGDYGSFTGASAYAYSHPSYAAEAAATGSFVPGGVSYPDTSASNPSPEATFSRPEPSAAGAMTSAPGQGHFLGMTLEPGMAADGRRGLRVGNIISGSTAENAGLQPGDLILSIDGRVTEQHQQLNAIIGNAAPGTVIRMNVVRASDGKEQALSIRIP